MLRGQAQRAGDRVPGQKEPSVEAPQEQRKYVEGNNVKQEKPKHKQYRRPFGASRVPLDKAAFEKAANPKPSTSSEDRNDIFARSGFVLEGFHALVPETRRQTFSLDFSQYQNLLRTSYLAISRVDKYFERNITLSAYEYYGMFLLWRRIYHVLAERGVKTLPTMNLNRIFEHCKMQVPKDLGAYLSGIGNTIDHEKREVLLSLAKDIETQGVFHDCVGGHFGRVSAQTHVYYETMPAPIVYLCRIMADLRYTENQQEDREWDLPPAIAPLNAQLRPNGNLMGWAPAARVSSDQKARLYGCGFQIDESFGIDEIIDGIPVSNGILTLVSTALSECKEPIALPESALYEGSVAQSYFTIPELVRRMQRANNRAGCEGTLKSLSQTNASTASAATAFRYRLKRSLSDDDAASLCYEFPNGDIIQDWVLTANTVFNRAPPAWNIAQWSSAKTRGDESAYAVSTQLLTRSSK